MRVTLIDNYDSFTFNLVHLLGELGAEVEVQRNDARSVADTLADRPDAIVLSPGPCTPNEAGICLDLVRAASATTPILGVCLGHQTIGQVFGGRVVRAPAPMHGKVSTVAHTGRALFRGVNGPFQATRYHSLVVERASAPEDLDVTAESDGLIMALSHRRFNVHGVQFHPESIASEHGRTILKNFLELARPELMDHFKPLIAKVAAGAELTRAEAFDAFEAMLSGDVTPAQIGGFLLALRVRGEGVEEITGAVAAMRARMLRVQAPDGAIDIVGTGGDGSGSYNVSTLAAIITAACGVPVAKHGNRAASSRSGSSDTLTALGVKIGLPPEGVERCLAEAGIGFMMAPTHHAAMRHVGAARVELGTRTIFNLLGPLSNPAGVKRQVIGVFSAAWLEPMAQVLRNHGSERVWICHGGDGLDEITTTTTTEIVELKDGDIRAFTIRPEDVGLKRATPGELKGGDPAQNARALKDVLAGARTPYRDIAVLNAAAALTVAGAARDLEDGVAKASKTLDNGDASRTLQKLVEVSNA